MPKWERDPDYNMSVRWDDHPGPEWGPVRRKEFRFNSKSGDEKAIEIADRIFSALMKRVESGTTINAALFRGKDVLKNYRETKVSPVPASQAVV